MRGYVLSNNDHIFRPTFNLPLLVYNSFPLCLILKMVKVILEVYSTCPHALALEWELT